MSQISALEAMLARGQDGELLRFGLANAYWKEKQAEPAIEHLQRAIELKPDYSAALKLLGRIYYDTEQFDLARETYELGLAAASANGDKQAEKEINVFLRRLAKLADG